MSSPPARNRRSQFFQVAEQTSVIASIVGVAVSAVSQQVVYAAAPLSLSLGLNLVNRRRFEQQTEQHLDRTIAQIDQQLAQLDQRVLNLPSLRPFSEQVESLTTQISTAAQQQAEARSQLAQLRSNFETIQQRQDSAANSLETRFLQIQNSLSQEIQSLRQQLEAGTSQQDELRLLQQALPNLSEQLTQLNAATQFELRSQITELRSQLTRELETQSNQTQFIREQAETALSNLNTVRSLQQTFADFAAQLDRLQTRLSEIESQQARINNVENRLPILETPPEIVIPEPLEESETSQIPILPTVEALEELEVLALNLGIDFGTSFTKVCFRDVARERSEIVTFTDELTHLEESLLPTKIGILKDGTLITGLTASEWQQYDDRIQTSIEFIKMRLADLDLAQSSANWRLEQLSELNHPETVENLCAYYLSRVICRTQTWIRQNKPELLLNQRIQWSANVGVPVEYCDSRAIERFKSVLSLAWMLSNEPQTEPMTMQNLSNQMTALRREKPQTDCFAIPEIAAEAWSLINSREVDEGFYVLFDVGDGTFDGSAFRYWNDRGEKKVDFYFGKVDPLGVAAFSQQLAKELGLSESDVRDTIFGNSMRYADRFRSSQTRKEIQKSVAKVVLQGSRRYCDHGFVLARPGFTEPLAILIGGGGGQTEFYQRAITATHTDFQQKNAGVPEYQIRSLPKPKDLEPNGIHPREFHRFSVAYGLSIPDGEQPEIRLPSRMEELKLNRSERDSYEPPNYDEMRGSW